MNVQLLTEVVGEVAEETSNGQKFLDFFNENQVLVYTILGVVALATIACIALAKKRKKH